MLTNPKFLAAITIIICAIMFAVGLKPKGFRLRNDVRWLEQTNGLSFGKMGIAYTEKNSSSTLSTSPESLSIEIVINAPVQRRNRLTAIFDLWNTRDNRHIALCQWDSTLIVMKTRSAFLRDSKLKLNKPINPKKTCHIVITSHRNGGTDLYINGAHARSSRAFDLCDSGTALGQLSLGSSSRANNSWRGEIRSLSIYKKAFDEKKVWERYRQWMQTNHLVETEGAIAAYSFDEHGGNIIRDNAGVLGDLHIPSILSIPQKSILPMPWVNFKINESFVNDFLVNLFGFIPFGFFFSALLWSNGGFARRYNTALCLLGGTAISVFIELVQAYIPTRSSQMLDVILNGLGTVIGALTARWFKLTQVSNEPCRQFE